jgi:hypothetical protein
VEIRREIRRRYERGRCPLCLGEEDAEHAFLKYSERKIEEKNLYAVNG